MTNLFEMNAVSKKVVSYLMYCCEQTSWQCYGAGEIGCEVVLTHPITEETYVVAEMSGDNGSNRFYNESGEPWVDDYPYDKVKEFCEFLTRNMDLDELFAIYTMAVMYKSTSGVDLEVLYSE